MVSAMTGIQNKYSEHITMHISKPPTPSLHSPLTLVRVLPAPQEQQLLMGTHMTSEQFGVQYPRALWLWRADWGCVSEAPTGTESFSGGQLRCPRLSRPETLRIHPHVLIFLDMTRMQSSSRFSISLKQLVFQRTNWISWLISFHRLDPEQMCFLLFSDLMKHWYKCPITFAKALCQTLLSSDSQPLCAFLDFWCESFLLRSSIHSAWQSLWERIVYLKLRPHIKLMCQVGTARYTFYV